MPSSSARFNADVILCEDLKKPEGPILTGVGFLDHMIDQINSHAQIGIALTIGNFADVATPTDDHDDSEEDHGDHRNRHARDQAKLMSLVGGKLGREIQKLVADKAFRGASHVSSRFCCPLDEALVVCQLKKMTTDDHSPGALQSYNLSPYGKFSRRFIGKLETEHLETFWQTLAQHSGLHVALTKVRGDNAHHIVESSFKAFSRALRNLLDGVDTLDSSSDENSEKSTPLSRLYGPSSDNWDASVALQRQGHVERKTKETSISVSLRLDGGAMGSSVSTGIQTLDSFLTVWAKEARCSLQLSCRGDLWIDEHHTAEDVSIALGQVVAEALGTKAGLNRMWSCQASCGASTVEVTVDLSNRPDLHHNLFPTVNDGGEMSELAGDLSLEMMEHVLESLVLNARMTVHIVETIRSPENPMDTVQAVAKALGRAFFYCASVDLRRAGSTASSKGTLSV